MKITVTRQWDRQYNQFTFQTSCRNKTFDRIFMGFDRHQVNKSIAGMDKTRKAAGLGLIVWDVQ